MKPIKTETVPSPQTQTGFSLIEIAVVLIIIGLLLGSMLMPLSTQIEKSRRNETKLLMDHALEAIYGYALMNGRLPCPDTDSDGMENRSGNNCTRVWGDLPWSTLGQSSQDAWGQVFGYRVTHVFADLVDGTGCPTATPGVSFSLCSTGDISVLDNAGGTPVAQNVPALLFSQAKNRRVPSPPDERENIDNDAVFVSKVYSSVAGDEYDDLLVWIAPGILMNRMVSGGRLP